MASHGQNYVQTYATYYLSSEVLTTSFEGQFILSVKEKYITRRYVHVCMYIDSTMNTVSSYNVYVQYTSTYSVSASILTV